MSKSSDPMGVHYSSASNEWQTPRWLFDLLNDEFGFDLDVAATDKNALCKRYYTAADDALTKTWGKDGRVAWMNPPYGRLIGRFVPYAFSQAFIDPGLTVVSLIPARVDTRWWHSTCPQGEVRFLKGRVGFVNPTLPSYREDGEFKVSPAPFPSAVVVFGKRAARGVTRYVDYKAPKG